MEAAGRVGRGVIESLGAELARPILDFVSTGSCKGSCKS